jgi:hypothetical protein
MLESWDAKGQMGLLRRKRSKLVKKAISHTKYGFYSLLSIVENVMRKSPTACFNFTYGIYGDWHAACPSTAAGP